MLDPIPTHLLKANLSSLAPVISDIVNGSMATGVFPSAFKNALVTPLLTKTTLDANDVKNYRPVSNLCFVSKIIEKVVAVRFSKHSSDNDLYEQMQSAYRPSHSTETALLRVRNDLLCILDERNAAILVLLDLSAAFDTIDHTIMLTRLRDRFGFESYLVNRSQRIQMHGKIPAERPVVFGVPQGPALGPLMYICSTAPLGDIARRRGINVHLYADDTQLYLAFSPHSEEDTIQAVMRIQDCVAELQDWMNINKLKFNATKTEIIVTCAPHIKTKVSMPLIKLGDTVVPVSTVAKNIGVFFDDALSMNNQVQHICRAAYFHIHCIGKIRNLLDRKTT